MKPHKFSVGKYNLEYKLNPNEAFGLVLMMVGNSIQLYPTEQTNNFVMRRKIVVGEDYE